ncbi:LPXTG cell wall anchor domain-containing protein [Streptomyces oryzae]|uniref:LPXTG cell wall anchor domain-containing protein n=1 Tax=Streptomyces oryzae TaxID=1434886 RepID=A0ABS3XFD4_9ACTN|nr:LPXTG cell wall anchor domain-containing protein [Streptomyces oryzae]MBO8194105.1 LPXTG cell wall anchor domain-containing protein [Streptomyces oryzae]
MRIFSSACTVVAGVAVSLLVGPVAHATPPGDNGTVKIHDAGTGEALRKNEPHVCTFYLDAFGFDAGQQVNWRIVEMPPTGSRGTVAKSDSLDLDAEGHGRSADLKLPDGHYKLIWNFDGEHGRAKHKVFWTDCADDDGESGGRPSTTPSASASPSHSGKPSAAPSDKPGEPGKPSEHASDTASPASAPSPNGGDGDLAETGTSVTAVSVAAALMLGAGGALLVRRRARGRS